MNRQILQAILNRAETEEMLFGWEDVSEWSKSALDTIRAMKLLRPASPASKMDCSDCERECLAAPVMVVERPNRTRQAYLACPEYGRVKKSFERLSRWQVNIDALATGIAGEFDGTAKELIPGRLWMIGTLEIGDSNADIFLARGLAWPDGDIVLREARSRKRSQTAVLIVPASSGGTDACDGSFAVCSLDEVLRLDGDMMSVDVSAIRVAAERSQAELAIGRPVRYRYLIRKGVDTWVIVYDGEEIYPPLKDMKGLHYLAFLLAHPNKKYYALQVIHEVDGTPYEPDEVYSAMGTEELSEHGLSVSGLTDAGEIMDPEYEKDIRNRLKEAQEKLKCAEAHNDTTLIRKVKNEIEQYQRALNEGIGLSGRHRSTGNAAERARVAVTQAISRVMKKLQNQHLALYEHLSGSLQTGAKCSYNLNIPIDWNS